MPQKKFDYWLTNDGLVLLSGWARDGCSDEQIASFIGVSPHTLQIWKNKFDQIAAALALSREAADYEVEDALRKNALAGNTTAQIFWLKNRRPDKWQDKPSEQKLSADQDADPLTQSIKVALNHAVL